MREQYDEKILALEASLKRDGKSARVAGNLKLLLVVLWGASLFFLFSGGIPVFWIIASALLLASTVALFVHHERLHRRLQQHRGHIAVCRQYLERITGGWTTSFPDTGAEFVDNKHAYGGDLDIVGRKSLFQFLNTTRTWHGRQAFAGDLLHPLYSSDQLHDRQEAISELARGTDFSHRLQYLLSQVGTASATRDMPGILGDDHPFISRKPFKFLLVYGTILTLLLSAAALLFGLAFLYPACAAAGVLHLALWIVGTPITKRYLATFSDLPYRLRALGDAIHHLAASDFSSPKLRYLQSVLGGRDGSMEKALKRLAVISDMVSVCHNGIADFVLGVLLLWNYRCAFLYERWKREYAHQAEGWFQALGEFESLLSFSHLPHACDNTCLPEIAPGKIVSATAIGHPLIPCPSRVDNDIDLDGAIFIISGSNMSGKTTLLRTVGVNLVLARAGGFVCAGRMRFSPAAIATSMRITDDLSDGISTFYAELDQIKRIITLAKSGEDMIFLIDEIFKGTNSVDRLLGAKAVISKLHELGAVGLVTTHDLDLCQLAEQFPGIHNHSFSERYEGGKILFDYKMKPGISRTTSAKYLMEMAGLILPP